MRTSAFFPSRTVGTQFVFVPLKFSSVRRGLRRIGHWPICRQLRQGIYHPSLATHRCHQNFQIQTRLGPCEHDRRRRLGFFDAVPCAVARIQTRFFPSPHSTQAHPEEEGAGEYQECSRGSICRVLPARCVSGWTSGSRCSRESKGHHGDHPWSSLSETPSQWFRWSRNDGPTARSQKCSSPPENRANFGPHAWCSAWRERHWIVHGFAATEQQNFEPVPQNDDPASCVWSENSGFSLTSFSPQVGATLHPASCSTKSRITSRRARIHWSDGRILHCQGPVELPREIENEAIPRLLPKRAWCSPQMNHHSVEHEWIVQLIDWSHQLSQDDAKHVWWIVE